MEKMNFGSNSSELGLDVNFKKALDNPTFCEIIKKIDVSKDILKENTSSLLECSDEIDNCKKCKGLYTCKNLIEGSYIYPFKSDNGIVFSYVNCRYKNKEKYKKNVNMFDLPIKLKDASLKDVWKDDKNRLELIKKITKFYDNYLKGTEVKGLYISGSFGVGKSYLVAALFNELAKKNVESVIVHVPELIRSIKDSFDKDYSDRFDLVKTTPLLLLDDIGAEYLTPWSRDEVLEPILQYRMDNYLPTFFTSNYRLEEIEKHFMIGDDKMKARRIMERIKEISEPIEVLTNNKRQKEE